jgi:hypothetical protein
MPHERFGEVAVGMGLMTQAELTRLLAVQAERKPMLVDILVRQGSLNWARVDEELAAYRHEMERRNVVIKRRIPTLPRLPVIPKLHDEREAQAVLI